MYIREYTSGKNVSTIRELFTIPSHLRWELIKEKKKVGKQEKSSKEERKEVNQKKTEKGKKRRKEKFEEARQEK